MELLDRDAVMGAPSSKFLTRKEMGGLYPDRMPVRKSYIFKYEVPLDVPVKEALVLTEKYAALKKKPVKQVEGGDELHKMTYQELQKLANQTYGLPWKEIRVKRDVLVDKIREIKLNKER